MKIKIFVIVISFCLISAFAVYQFINSRDKKLHVVFCNIGQGDAIYIRTPEGSDILIDAGPDNSILECLGRHMPFWDKTIELAFATHPDADHIGGFTHVLTNYKVKSYNTVHKAADTGVYLRIQDQLRLQNTIVRYLYSGDAYMFAGGVKLTTFWPSREFISGETNPYSLIQMLNFNKFDLLLNGDIEFDTLNTILRKAQDDNVIVEVFKLPHHGSKTGVDVNTFNLIQPKVSIISAGENNRYGHPHFSVTGELHKHNLKYLETKNGDVEIVSDGETWTISQ